MAGWGVSGPQMGSRTAPSGGFPYDFNTVGCLGPALTSDLLNSGFGPIE